MSLLDRRLVAFLRYSAQGLPHFYRKSFLGRIDPYAIASRALVKSFYVRVRVLAENIQKHEAERGRNSARVYQEILNVPMHGLAILEIGAGPGAVACGFYELGAKAVAIDLWDGRIFTHPEVGFGVSNASQLPFKDGSFNAASLTSVLHHIPVGDTVMALTEALRVVRPGGLLFIQEEIASQSFLQNLLMKLVDNLVSGRIGTHQAGAHHSVSGWVAILASFGLRIIGTRYQNPTWLGLGVEKIFFVLRKPSRLGRL